MDGAVRRFADLAAELRAKPGTVRLVGIDGCGGAGKTTFADRLAHALGDAPVIHTDDFASHDEPIEWWPKFFDDVVDPLMRGAPASYRPYDWVAHRRGDATITVQPASLVIVEGVGATRAAWRDLLAERIWVEAPRDVRMQRGIERDGEELREFWTWWMAAEDRYVAAERPRQHADLVVDGAPSQRVSDDEYVEVISAPT